MKYLEDLKVEGYQQIHEFKENNNHQWSYLFVKSKKALKSMNDVMGAGFKAVYIQKRDGETKERYFKDEDIDLSGLTVYVWTSKDKVVRFTNSEWGGVEIV